MDVGRKLKSAYAFWRYYRVVIIFPTFTVTSILADYLHTKHWKAEQLQKKKQLQSSLIDSEELHD
ncbi:uncharacterized protein LOC123294697 isoform X1 [Chrysoperla carnea]|uniref:uncharacterized protein LOC123294697 isoform X1 n=1 Tax=Chrysoperla carnea TaxID=189513 RepID=UPI001D085924|nr:uncharacterized protein LOC123294697 isoform X1 [Chrysoperla carnea]